MTDQEYMEKKRSYYYWNPVTTDASGLGGSGMKTVCKIIWQEG